MALYEKKKKRPKIFNAVSIKISDFPYIVFAPDKIDENWMLLTFMLCGDYKD